jgi:SagB-type dehydrogenase family enzyme
MSLAGSFERLPEPRVREHELPFQPYPFTFTSRRLLPVPGKIGSDACLEVLHRRRSRRRFGPLQEDQLSALLWFAAKTLAMARQPSGFLWQHRPAPSAGGRHPVCILVCTPFVRPFELSVYDPDGHALLNLKPTESKAEQAFIDELQTVLPIQDGTVFWFAADFLRTASRYESGGSLVWRDAGALLATIHIAAEALRLHCCAYGPIGDERLSDILPSSRFSAVGGCIVGSIPD